MRVSSGWRPRIGEFRRADRNPAEKVDQLLLGRGVCEWVTE